MGYTPGEQDTIAAIATATGGAIGVVRVSGAQAVNLTSKIFSKDLTKAKGYSMHHGNVHEVGDTQKIIDEVIVCVFRAPHSYTGEDAVEITCHGSRYILREIMNALCKAGARPAGPGEFTKRAFTNGKMDLSQAEAVADLIASENKKQHRLALSHLRGGITTRLDALREELLHLTSLLELELDFSDQDLEFADRTKIYQLTATLKEHIKKLIATFKEGNAIREGVPVAILGAPNVGKSTLLNALVGDDRAIVSDIKGTTRDTIEDTVTIDGQLFRIIDTAGLRHTNDTIEKMGIERSMKAAKKADIVLLVTEPGVPYPTYSPRDGQHVIHILNKSTEFQAINGTGLENLKQQLLALATHTASEDRNGSALSTGEQVIISNVRHKSLLELSLDDLQRADDAMRHDLPTDLVSEDLRLCLEHLGDITGDTITPEETLRNIFSHFCVGK